MRTLDPDLLRTLVAFADTGSLASAARAVNRTASAVTAQMQRLEADLGLPLLEPAGRGRVLTEAGRRLAAHGRRILALHRDAWLEVTGAQVGGTVRLGATQDIAEAGLPDLLASFAASHPGVRLDLRVDRSAHLAQEIAEGRLDVAVLMRSAEADDEIGAFDEPMLWLCARSGLAASADPLPLALLDPPCSFRDAGLRALEAAGLRHRIAATSANPAGLRAAVRAGLAVTARTARWIDDAVGPAPSALGLPALPSARYAVRLHALADAPGRRLAELLASELAAGRGTVRSDAG